MNIAKGALVVLLAMFIMAFFTSGSEDIIKSLEYYKGEKGWKAEVETTVILSDGFDLRGLKDKGQSKIINSPETGGMYYHNIYQTKDVNKAFDYKKYMDEYYKDYGIKHITYLRLTREISGNMSENWCRQAAYKFANDAGINLLYDNNKTAIYNCYGYSRELSDHIDADANKINVEMAFWYDEIKNVTNFTIGYPVVNGEF